MYISFCPFCLVIHPYSSISLDIHWCSRTNGECEGNEALCLVRDHYYFDCRCPPTEYISVSYDGDREVCRQHCNGKTFNIMFIINKIC